MGGVDGEDFGGACGCVNSLGDYGKGFLNKR
jgi:hypothetical protein